MARYFRKIVCACQFALKNNCSSIQDAADLQWPASNSANAGLRDQFRLNTFPPVNPADPATPMVPPAPAKLMPAPSSSTNP
jgi:hypothetical protein